MINLLYLDALHPTHPLPAHIDTLSCLQYNTDNEDRRYLLEHRKLTLQGGRVRDVYTLFYYHTHAHMQAHTHTHTHTQALMHTRTYTHTHTSMQPHMHIPLTSYEYTDSKVTVLRIQCWNKVLMCHCMQSLT